MARKKPSKSAAIRRYAAKHPTAKASEIARAVGAQVALVYNVRATDKKKNGKAASGSKRKAKPATPKNRPDQVLLAAKFVQSCGGIDEAKLALDTLEQVAEALA